MPLIPLTHHIPTNSYIQSHETLVGFEIKLIDVLKKFLESCKLETVPFMINKLVHKINEYNEEKPEENPKNRTFHTLLYNALSLCISTYLFYSKIFLGEYVNIWKLLIFESPQKEQQFIKKAQFYVFRNLVFFREIER